LLVFAWRPLRTSCWIVGTGFLSPFGGEAVPLSVLSSVPLSLFVSCCSSLVFVLVVLLVVRGAVGTGRVAGVSPFGRSPTPAVGRVVRTRAPDSGFKPDYRGPPRRRLGPARAHAQLARQRPSMREKSTHRVHAGQNRVPRCTGGEPLRQEGYPPFHRSSRPFQITSDSIMAIAANASPVPPQLMPATAIPRPTSRPSERVIWRTLNQPSPIAANPAAVASTAKAPPTSGPQPCRAPVTPKQPTTSETTTDRIPATKPPMA